MALGLLVFGMAATLMFSYSIKQDAETAALQEFNFICDEIQSNISDRLTASAQVLYSGAALFETSGTVSREDWETFTRMLRIEKNLPGTQGVGFSQLVPPDQLGQHIEQIRSEGFPEYTIKPEGPREMYSSIIYLEPFSDRNLRAFGYDMYSEPVRRAAMDQARDENTAVLSGKVTLVQETDTDVQAGTLMYVPVYRPGQPINTLEQRRAAILGWVYSPYRMTDLMQGTLGAWEKKQKNKHIYLEVYDGDPASADTLLYDSRSETDKAVSSTRDLSRIMEVDFAGQRWTVQITQIGGISSLAEYGSAWLALLGGTSTTLLLTGLMLSLLRTRVNAQRIANELSGEIQAGEEKFRQFFEQSSEGIAMLDESGRAIEWNHAMESITGLARAQVLGAEFVEVQSALSPAYTPPEIFEQQKAMVEQALKSGAAPFLNKLVEARYKTVDGTIRLIQQMVFPIKDVNGFRLGILSRDVTENVQAKKDLQEQTKRLNQLLEFSEEFLETSTVVEFQAITDHVLAISGGRYATFNIWDQDAAEFQTIAAGGLSQDNLLKTSSMLGFDLIGKKWPLSADIFEWFKKDSIIKFSSLDEFASRLIPAPIAKILENLLHTGEIIIAQVIIRSQYYGNFAIFMPQGMEFNAEDLVNIYTRQVGLLFQRQFAEKALRESEARFRQMFEKHAAIMLLIDPASGKIMDANPAAVKFYGYSREQLCSMSINEINVLSEEEIAAERKKAASQERNHFIFPHRLASGEQRIVEVHSSPIGYQDRQLLFSIIHDITERKQAERVIERNRKFLTTLHDATLELLGSRQSGVLLQRLVEHASHLLESPSCEILLEKDGELVVEACTANQAHLLGEKSPRGRAQISWQAFDSQQPVAMDEYSTWEGCNPAYTPLQLHAVADFPIISGGRSIGILALGRTEMGRPYTAQEIQEGLIFSQLAALMLENNNLYEEAVREVSVRRAAEEAVRTSEEKFRAMVENSSEGILLVDEQGIVVEWNYAQEQITGIPMHEAVGRPIWGIQFQLMAPSRKSRDAEEIIKQGALNMLKTGQSPAFFHPVEHSIQTPSGEVRTILQNSFPIKTSLGYRVASIIHDITERKQMEIDLFTSEEKLRAILDHSHDAIGVYVNGIWEMCNPAAMKMFGLSPNEDLSGSPVLDIITAAERTRVEALMRDRVEGRDAPNSYITRGIKRDGLEFDMEVTVSTFTLEGMTNALLIMRDITEQMRAENALRESEARFRLMADTTPSLVWQAGTDAKCDYFNKTWLEFTGRSMEQEMGNGWTEGVHPDDLQACMDTYMNAFRARHPFTMEYRLHHADGTYHWLMDTGIPRFTPDGTFVGYIGSCTDISALKQLEEELQTQRDFANQIITLMGQGLTVSDMDGCFEFVNPAYAALLGYKQEELIGKHPSDFTLPEDHTILAEQRTMRAVGRTSTYETRLQSSDGRILPVLITGVPRKPQSDGVSYGAIAVITDLTEQKAAEHELRAARDKISRALTREQELARKDELTGIFNRRHIYELAESQVDTAVRYGQPLAVIMFDIDRFKQVNDVFGHQSGDIVLKSVTQAASAELRTADRIGRVGGDEFIILLPMTNIDQAYYVAERIRTTVEKTNIALDAKEVFVTLSIGIVEIKPGSPAETVEEVFHRADKAMYTAKFSGTNRIAVLP